MGSVWALALAASLLTVGCAGPGSEAGQQPLSTDEETVDETTGDSNSSGGEDTLVDWSEGLTQQEQLAEIELVVSVMQDHFGEDVAQLDGGDWDLQEFATWPGHPTPSHRADDHYYYVDFDFSEVKANQETQEKALAVLEEIGLSPNGEQPTTYDEDRRNPLYVAGGEDDYGRLFLVQQRRPGAGISATFSTRHSDHGSMYEAHEASWED